MVKYSFKNELSLRVDAASDANFSTLLHSHVISSEEAFSEIFSFDYYRADTRCEFLSLQSPERRVAAFVHGEPLQATEVEKHFWQPASLDRLPSPGILFSLRCHSFASNQCRTARTD